QSDESAKLLAAALTGDGLVTSATTGSASQAVAPNSMTPTVVQAQPVPVQPIPAAATATDASATAPVDFNKPDLFNQPYTPTVTRALAIAAIAILGEGGEDHADAMTQLLSENDGPQCL